MDPNGKVALVTGGTRGIGAATALWLAERGADAALVGRHDDDAARAVCSQIEALGRRAIRLTADCALPDDCTRVVEQTAAQLGSLDILVHAAGGPVNGRLLEITPEDWHAACAVHLHAVFYLCRAAVPWLRRRGEGAIVLVSSTAGLRGVATNVAYQTVKGALPQLTRALARELAEDNVRVNCAAPGVIRTRFHDAMTPETRAHNLQHRIPLHREGTPAQVATLIGELVTNDYITGETMVIDGGLTMRIA
jgi:NAD(P)-dependent dehydrogenase (short-subunit alcohol dehydrogenase family)